MGVESALYDHVVGDATLLGLLSTRVYPGTSPQGRPLPCLTFHVVSTEHDRHHTASGGLARVGMQIDAWAETSTSRREVVDALVDRLHAYRGPMGDESLDVRQVHMDGPVHSYEEPTNGSEQGTYRGRLEATIVHADGTPTGVHTIRLIATGQTVGYSVTGRTAKDDGDLELGFVKSYTVRTTGQYQGNRLITVGTASGLVTNNCVTDNRTQLMWCREHHPTSVLWDDSTGSGEDIFALVDEANTQSLGGHTDWRVPNVNEVLSILHWGQFAPCINQTAFPNWFPGWVWTSSTDPDNTDRAGRVNFNAPAVETAPKVTTNAFAAFVRGNSL